MKIALIVLAALLLVALPMVFRFGTAKSLARDSTPYRQDGSGQRVLFVGDSTGVGTGASPQQSVAGRLGEHNRSLVIFNRSEDGARISDVMRQLDRCTARSAEAVVIMAGGNDVIGYTSRDFLELEAAAMLIAARRCAPHVVWVANGNVGLAPFFPWPLSALFTRRARDNRASLSKLAAQYGVEWVDLFREKQDDTFHRDPARYYAADKLHPSADGYAVWFDEARRQSPTFGRMAQPARHLTSDQSKQLHFGT